MAGVAAMLLDTADADTHRNGCRELMNLSSGDVMANMQAIVDTGGVAAVVAAVGQHTEDVEDEGAKTRKEVVAAKIKMAKDMRAQQVEQRVEQMRAIEQQRVEQMRAIEQQRVDNKNIMKQQKEYHQQIMDPLLEQERLFQEIHEAIMKQQSHLEIEVVKIEGRLSDRMDEMEIAKAEIEHASKKAEHTEVVEYIAKTANSIQDARLALHPRLHG